MPLSLSSWLVLDGGVLLLPLFHCYCIRVVNVAIGTTAIVLAHAVAVAFAASAITVAVANRCPR